MINPCLLRKNTRRVSQSLTLPYNKVRFLLTERPFSLRAIGRDVTVYDYPDGRLEIRYQGALLTYTTFDTLRRVNRPDLVENKRLSATLETIMRMEAEGAPKPRPPAIGDHYPAAPRPGTCLAKGLS
ncbi:MAG: hypothetical protein JJU26_00520 [Oceanicaulis sp.]|uniref:hypothetical protein n=1 Tax=Glycocaulis sp. TaxID=1969725 RepID=UPI0025B9B0C4|nr:hypothetical protein [Glycocaulis sp.]MCC5980180.1 hypothetical protein [Oceanicaulis sp.]MCH8521440.1 hypothetical protein [Glycocaulis sp.]